MIELIKKIYVIQNQKEDMCDCGCNDWKIIYSLYDLNNNISFRYYASKESEFVDYDDLKFEYTGGGYKKSLDVYLLYRFYLKNPNQESIFNLERRLQKDLINSHLDLSTKNDTINTPKKKRM